MLVNLFDFDRLASRRVSRLLISEYLADVGLAAIEADAAGKAFSGQPTGCVIAGRSDIARPRAITMSAATSSPIASVA